MIISQRIYLSVLICLLMALEFSCTKEETETQPKTTYQKTFGEDGYDAGEEALIVNDDLFIVGTTDRNDNSQKDILFMSISKGGKELFTTTFGSNAGDDEGLGMVQSLDGNIVLIGYTTSASNGRDCWIQKTDLFGRVIWEKQFGGPLDDVANDIILLSNGEFFVAGHSENSEGKLDSYFLWIDQNGELIRESRFKVINGGLYESAASVIQSADGNLQIYGHFDLDGTNRDFYWVEMTSTGGVIGFLGGGADGYDEAQQLIETSDGHLLFCGHSTAEDPLHNMSLDKIDRSAGLTPKTIWTKQFGGDKHDGGMALMENSKGNYVAVARSNSFKNGDENIYLVEVDDSGEVIQDKVYGGRVTDRAECIIEDNGFFYLIGRSDSYGNNMQVFVVKTKI